MDISFRYRFSRFPSDCSWYLLASLCSNDLYPWTSGYVPQSKKKPGPRYVLWSWNINMVAWCFVSVDHLAFIGRDEPWMSRPISVEWGHFLLILPQKSRAPNRLRTGNGLVPSRYMFISSSPQTQRQVLSFTPRNTKSQCLMDRLPPNGPRYKIGILEHAKMSILATPHSSTCSSLATAPCSYAVWLLLVVLLRLWKNGSRPSHKRCMTTSSDIRSIPLQLINWSAQSLWEILSSNQYAVFQFSLPDRRLLISSCIFNSSQTRAPILRATLQEMIQEKKSSLPSEVAKKWKISSSVGPSFILSIHITDPNSFY